MSTLQERAYKALPRKYKQHIMTNPEFLEVLLRRRGELLKAIKIKLI